MFLRSSACSAKVGWVDLAAKVFPVLGRVPGITTASSQVVEPMRVRRRALAALRELLASAAARRQLVLHVDDAQWGDADSAALLLELLRPPTVFRLMLIASYRQEEESSAFLRELRARVPERVQVRELQVGPLAPDDAERLALELLGSDERSRLAAQALLSSLLHAAIANARGDAGAAIASLEASIETARRAEMAMHGAAATRQLGRLLGGDEGAHCLAEAEAAMNTEDIRAPDRWAAMLVPGRWDRA